MSTANYNKTYVDLGCGNPLIEALDPVKSAADYALALTVKPPLNKPDVRLSPDIRRQALGVLFDVFATTPPVLSLARSVFDTMRLGYLKRNPMVAGYWCEKNGAWVNGKLITAHQPVTGINFAGEAGLGKSVSIKKILALQPQVITHTEYVPPSFEQALRQPHLQHLEKNQPFPHVQITWLFVECQAQTPSDLAKAFFEAVDKATGYTDYSIRFKLSGRRYQGKKTGEDEDGKGLVWLERMVYKVARNHSLGLLVVDEIQRLKTSRRTINFLVSLNNMMKVPVMHVGLPESIGMFEIDESLARRGTTTGDHHWVRVPWSDNEAERKLWNLFATTLWPYNILRDGGDLTTEMSYAWWQACQGIFDYGVKIFRAAQERALDLKQEKLTVEIMQSVAKDTLLFSKLILHSPGKLKDRQARAQRYLGWYPGDKPTKR